jgi:hypothetical protein
LKISDHLYLKPNANSVPAAPAPQIIIFGVIFFSNKKSSFYLILLIKSFIGLVVNEFSQIPGILKLLFVTEPILIERTSYSTKSPFYNCTLLLSASILTAF